MALVRSETMESPLFVSDPYTESGLLSIEAATPFYLEGNDWPSVAHYAHAQLMCTPSVKTLIRTAGDKERGEQTVEEVVIDETTGETDAVVSEGRIKTVPHPASSQKFQKLIETLTTDCLHTKYSEALVIAYTTLFNEYPEFTQKLVETNSATLVYNGKPPFGLDRNRYNKLKKAKQEIQQQLQTKKDIKLERDLSKITTALRRTGNLVGRALELVRHENRTENKSVSAQDAGRAVLKHRLFKKYTDKIPFSDHVSVEYDKIMKRYHLQPPRTATENEMLDKIIQLTNPGLGEVAQADYYARKLDAPTGLLLSGEITEKEAHDMILHSQRTPSLYARQQELDDFFRTSVVDTWIDASRATPPEGDMSRRQVSNLADRIITEYKLGRLPEEIMMPLKLIIDEWDQKLSALKEQEVLTTYNPIGNERESGVFVIDGTVLDPTTVIRPPFMIDGVRFSNVYDFVIARANLPALEEYVRQTMDVGQTKIKETAYRIAMTPEAIEAEKRGRSYLFWKAATRASDAKFSNNDVARKYLLQTGDRQLLYTGNNPILHWHPERDWNNGLGKTLMDLRTKFKHFRVERGTVDVFAGMDKVLSAPANLKSSERKKWNEELKLALNKGILDIVTTYSTFSNWVHSPREDFIESDDSCRVSEGKTSFLTEVLLRKVPPSPELPFAILQQFVPGNVITEMFSEQPCIIRGKRFDFTADPLMRSHAIKKLQKYVYDKLYWRITFAKSLNVPFYDMEPVWQCSEMGFSTPKENCAASAILHILRTSQVVVPLQKLTDNHLKLVLQLVLLDDAKVDSVMRQMEDKVGSWKKGIPKTFSDRLRSSFTSVDKNTIKHLSMLVHLMSDVKNLKVRNGTDVEGRIINYAIALGQSTPRIPPRLVPREPKKILTIPLSSEQLRSQIELLSEFLDDPENDKAMLKEKYAEIQTDDDLPLPIKRKQLRDIEINLRQIDAVKRKLDRLKSSSPTPRLAPVIRPRFVPGSKILDIDSAQAEIDALEVEKETASAKRKRDIGKRILFLESQIENQE